MSNTDICTCDYFPHCQDVICMTCGKSQKHAGEVLRQLMAENERLRWALETVAFVRHKAVKAGRCPGCRKIAERILAGATIEAALDGAHVPEEEVLR